MCTNDSTSTADAAERDVHVLLAAPAGPDVIRALTLLDPMELGEADRLVLLEVHEKQQAWLVALAVPAMVAFAGERPIDSDDFVREDVRAALRCRGRRRRTGSTPPGCSRPL